MDPFSGVLELLIFKIFRPLRPNRDTKPNLNPQRGPFPRPCFWIHLLILASSFCSMSRLAGRFLPRKITKRTSFPWSAVWSILWKLYDYNPQLTYCEKQQKSLARNLTKLWFTTLKYQKAPTAISKENLRFKQFPLNCINSQKKQTETERLRLVISTIRLGVVAKTDIEFYVSSSMTMFSYYSFVFSTFAKKVQLL